MVGGIVNDNIVFPVLDLIRKEMKSQGYRFDGIPSVILHRDHPLDRYIVTAANLMYESGLEEEIILSRGSDDETTYPEGVEVGHPEYEFCRYWRLTEVTITYFRQGEELIESYTIRLFYNKDGLLESTDVSRM